MKITIEIPDDDMRKALCVPLTRPAPPPRAP
jgi:hypothetical protein